MSQNANSIPLDDEDILDLTVVAEPGNKSGEAEDFPPEPGEGGADFGADLDALLDSLAPDGSVPTVSAPLAAPVAAPIADQTPTDHIVDPNEEITMPEMSDIDSLLAELGADIPAEQPIAAPVISAPAEALVAQSAPIADFDGILAQAQKAEAQKAVQATPPAAEPTPASAKPAPPAQVDPFEAAQNAAAASAPAPEKIEVTDSLDLNELDALLDDILATAPEMSVPSSPAQEAAPLHPPVSAMDALPVPDQAILPAPGDSGLAERVRQIEEAFDAMDNVQMPEAMLTALVDSKINALMGPSSPAMGAIVNAVMDKLAAVDSPFHENIEKMAAAAAAKVIREEIATIMNDG